MLVELMRGNCGDSKVCPALHRTDRGTVVVQGWAVNDAQLLGRLDPPAGEEAVEVPAELLAEVLDSWPAPLRTGLGTLIVPGAPVTDPGVLRQLSLPAGERAVEVPAGLLTEVLPGMLSEAELDPFFDTIGHEAFRLEALPAYAVPVESAGLCAYLAGEPFQKSQAGEAFNEYIRGQVEAGVAWHRVRVVRSPLSDYERWECEWSYAVSEEFGHHTFVIDLSETPDPPELPDYDWWMLDERVVLRFHYDASGAFRGADPLEDAGQLAEHRQYRDAALAAAVPFPEYWAAHPQYWRENWLEART